MQDKKLANKMMHSKWWLLRAKNWQRDDNFILISSRKALMTNSFSFSTSIDWETITNETVVGVSELLKDLIEQK